MFLHLQQSLAVYKVVKPLQQCDSIAVRGLVIITLTVAPSFYVYTVCLHSITFNESLSIQ